MLVTIKRCAFASIFALSTLLFIACGRTQETVGNSLHRANVFVMSETRWKERDSVVIGSLSKAEWEALSDDEKNVYNTFLYYGNANVVDTGNGWDCDSFSQEYPNKDTAVFVYSFVNDSDSANEIAEELFERGYTRVYLTDVSYYYYLTAGEKANNHFFHEEEKRPVFIPDTNIMNTIRRINPDAVVVDIRSDEEIAAQTEEDKRGCDFFLIWDLWGYDYLYELATGSQDEELAQQAAYYMFNMEDYQEPLVEDKRILEIRGSLQYDEFVKKYPDKTAPVFIFDISSESGRSLEYAEELISLGYENVFYTDLEYQSSLIAEDTSDSVYASEMNDNSNESEYSVTVLEDEWDSVSSEVESYEYYNSEVETNEDIAAEMELNEPLLEAIDEAADMEGYETGDLEINNVFERPEEFEDLEELERDEDSERRVKLEESEEFEEPEVPEEPDEPIIVDDGNYWTVVSNTTSSPYSFVVYI